MLEQLEKQKELVATSPTPDAYHDLISLYRAAENSDEGLKTLREMEEKGTMNSWIVVFFFSV